jgi:hypothetical protein
MERHWICWTGGGDPRDHARSSPNEFVEHRGHGWIVGGCLVCFNHSALTLTKVWQYPNSPHPPGDRLGGGAPPFYSSSPWWLLGYLGDDYSVLVNLASQF